MTPKTKKKQTPEEVVPPCRHCGCKNWDFKITKTVTVNGTLMEKDEPKTTGYEIRCAVCDMKATKHDAGILLGISIFKQIKKEQEEAADV